MSECAACHTKIGFFSDKELRECNFIDCNLGDCTGCKKVLQDCSEDDGLYCKKHLAHDIHADEEDEEDEEEDEDGGETMSYKENVEEGIVFAIFRAENCADDEDVVKGMDYLAKQGYALLPSISNTEVMVFQKAIPEVPRG